MADQQPAVATKSTGDNHSANLQALLVKASEAEARYDHETAVAAYTAALNLPDLTNEEQYEILDGRATAYNNWGIPKQISADAKNIISLARRLDDKRCLVEAMAVHGFNWRMYGSDKPSPEVTEEAFLLADDLNDDRLLGYCNLILAVQAWNAGDPDKAWDYLNKALEAARRSGDDDILFEVVRLHAVSHDTFGRTDDALRILDEMLSLAQKSGSELKRYKTLLLYGNTVPDLAARRDYYEQATHAETTANYRIGSATVNTAELFWKLGLYSRALDYATKALQRAIVSGMAYSIGGASDTLGRVLLARGLLDEAGQVFQEGSTSAETSSQQKAFNVLGLAELALARGQLSEAAAHFQSAGEIFKSLEPVALSGLGVTHLAMGQLEEALAYSKESVAFLGAGLASTEYHEQEIWWRHYQVLKAAGKEDSFTALDKARQTMLANIETLSDEGLRRNYLNEVAVNHDITLTWTAEAHKRDIPLDPFTMHEPLTGHLRAQFRRVVDIGARLTAQHDPESLAGFIVDEFVEMSGAERVLLIRDYDGEPTISAAHNPDNAAEIAVPLLDKMRSGRQPILEQDAGEVPTGEIPELHLRSIVALPLVTSDRFLGLLYGDMRQIFGRFNEADVQLLGMLANQAAAALENADLVSTLEDKVEERTGELKSANENLAARNDELAIINGVQEALAAELDLQSIFNIVGDKLSEIYGTDSIALWTYDRQKDMAFPRYYKESGKFANVEPQPPGPIGRILLQTHEPILLRTQSDYDALDHIQPAGTVPAESGMYVPLIVGNELIGVIYLFSFKMAAYDESDLRLLTTLANSMSITLENARLFNDAREARAEAEQANAAKSAFMSNMSHELRTPLNAIIGFTRIVQRKTKGQVAQKQTDNLSKVLSSGQHLLGLINTVLDIAKIEAGRMDVINSRFNIGQLIEDVSTISQPLLKSDVDLRLNIAAGLPEINSDQDKIKQILLNLLSNAAKFTHEGSITVNVCVGALREAPLQISTNKYLTIDVSDTGLGMSEEALSRVFEEFQQADATTRKQYGGTGLGMPISKHLAQLLGGDLTVTSSEGEGSTFTLTLPIS